MYGANASKSASATGRGHASAMMSKDLAIPNRSFVPRYIAWPGDDPIISAWKKTPVHVVEEIKAIIVIVLNCRYVCHRLLTCGVAINIYISVNRVGRTNILGNILHCAAAKGKGGNNRKYNEG